MTQPMTEEEKRLHRCCFTGHRPEKLCRSAAGIKEDLEAAIRTAAAEGFTTFVTGMARGVDLWAGEIVIRLKAEMPELKLIAAHPHPNFAQRWDADWQALHAFVTANADHEVTLSKGFHPGAYRIRNRWMVEQAQLLISVYDGGPGGTASTVRYAERRGVPIRSLWR